MKGTDKVRFCSHCAKDVNNLSEMTRKEATRLVRASDGQICVRYIANPVTRRPMFAEQLLQITRRTPSLAAGVMTASVALASQAYSQGGTTISPARSVGMVAEIPGEQKVVSRTEANGRISGMIADSAGAVVPAVHVSLLTAAGDVTRSTTSDGDGNYGFDDVPDGKYSVATEAISGFSRRRIDGIEVNSGRESVVNLELYAEVSVTVGMIVAVENRSPLAQAAANEDIALVRELLTQGEKVNGKDENYGSMTPLFVAVGTGNIEIVELLLDFGAKVNARDDERQTPLMHLDYDATPELVGLLVRHGAKLNLTDKENNTALIIGTDNGISAGVVEALIRAGADVKLANKAGTTALMNAANRDDLASVKFLVEAGADVNAKDDDGETAWDKTSDEEIEQYLVGHGAIVDADEAIEDEPDPSR